MRRAAPEPVGIAILAKAPVPGLAKTRLIPALGAGGAAALQEQLILRTVEIACAAATGPVTVWATPDASHAVFRNVAEKFAVGIVRQPDGDLGARMLAAVAAAQAPALVIGTDCPALTSGHLVDAAIALREGLDAVVIPAEDGGYVLIGLRRPEPALFADMTWSTDTVMTETRARIARLGLAVRELPPLWDVDRPEDLERMTGR
jgi:rSAM/selenodomain-associated transferase 1